ncbi:MULTISPECIES: lipocalin family protein [unclassified Leeuwenhoekiella]|uniref:lipocalin family protein n=1 Tax=unclassified Leeuwenhoekiella TaxID=2615029 RepID=UPI000C4BAF5A|nr:MULTISPECIES: lipocalin family protein [unclassified Leeuwenhoekiella]MAW94572.1 hypothetical protein [Leeuwenhoekiella sp.]MBA81995.1 hypothetical protein [Leeuwenhoekiella sp.]
MKSSFYIVIVISFLVLGCARNNPHEQLQHLNGYWEIKEVKTGSGKEREYSFSEQVDYIEIKDSTGFRTKVLPRIDGTFATTDSRETVTAHIANDSLYLKYSTTYDTWQEVVLKANSEELQVRNAQGITYTYKKFEPINITD